MKRQAEGPPAGIVIVGCHRSGTSALAAALAKLGWALPTSVIGAVRGNDRGHYEPAAMVEANDNLLEGLQRSWFDPKPLPPDWTSTAPARELAAGAGRLLQELFEGQTYLVKDPRLSMLLPLWIPALASLGGTPLALIVCRNPYEVAKSLRHRNGLSVPHGLSLWHSYILQAERNTRGLRRMLIHFESLLEDGPAELVRILAAAGGHARPESPEVTAAAGTLLSSARHVRINPDEFLNNQNVMYGIRETYRVLLSPEGLNDTAHFDRAYVSWQESWQEESPGDGPSRLALQSPEHFHVLSHRALEDGDLEAATAHAERAVALAPKQAVTHFQLGKVLMRAGQFAAAGVSFRQALSLNPNLPGCAAQLASALRQSGDADGALAFVLASLEDRPGEVALSMQAAQLLSESGHNEKAAWYVSQAIGRHGLTAPLALQMSRIFRRANQRDIAFGYAREALHAAGESASLRYQAAIQMSKAGHADEAVKVLKSLLSEDRVAEQAQSVLDQLGRGDA